ncbi:MAG: signal peptidase II [Chitinophagaceae bacterium]|nr:signal peptidase II [Chitinophagaceae bacterium]
MLYGSVTDFLFIHSGMFRTGIFNMADTSIMLGSLLFIIPVLFNAVKMQLR